MKDRWMNVGHEDDELKPYVEPLPDYKDPRRTGEAGLSREGKPEEDSGPALTTSLLCRADGVHGLHTGRDPGLTGGPEVQRGDGHLSAPGLQELRGVCPCSVPPLLPALLAVAPHASRPC